MTGYWVLNIFLLFLSYSNPDAARAALDAGWQWWGCVGVCTTPMPDPPVVLPAALQAKSPDAVARRK